VLCRISAWRFDEKGATGTKLLTSMQRVIKKLPLDVLKGLEDSIPQVGASES
jgi:hypothetical protein